MQFGLGIHHKRAIARDRLLDRLTGDEQEARAVRAGLKPHAVPGPENVSLNFRVQGPSPAAAPALAGPQLVAGPPLALDGTNGSLRIDEVLHALAGRFS